MGAALHVIACCSCVHIVYEKQAHMLCCEQMELWKDVH